MPRDDDDIEPLPDLPELDDWSPLDDLSDLASVTVRRRDMPWGGNDDAFSKR
jgi:hypothetical protein